MNETMFKSVSNLTSQGIRLTYWKPMYEGLYLDTNIDILIEPNKSVDLPKINTEFKIISYNYAYDILKFNLGSYGVIVFDPDIAYNINNLALEVYENKI